MSNVIAVISPQNIIARQVKNKTIIIKSFNLKNRQRCLTDKGMKKKRKQNEWQREWQSER
jgi:hypothetical protein